MHQNFWKMLLGAQHGLRNGAAGFVQGAHGPKARIVRIPNQPMNRASCYRLTRPSETAYLVSSAVE